MDFARRHVIELVAMDTLLARADFFSLHRCEKGVDQDGCIGVELTEGMEGFIKQPIALFHPYILFHVLKWRLGLKGGRTLSKQRPRLAPS